MIFFQHIENLDSIHSSYNSIYAAIAYAAYQRGDIDYNEYQAYKTSYALPDPFEGEVLDTVRFVDDGWSEVDDIGFWIPPSTSNPDGYWTGAIHTNAGLENWDWSPIPSHRNSPFYTGPVYWDAIGHSFLEDHLFDQPTSDFKHVLEFGGIDPPTQIPIIPTGGYRTNVPGGIPYAMTQKSFQNVVFRPFSLAYDAPQWVGSGFYVIDGNTYRVDEDPLILSTFRKVVCGPYPGSVTTRNPDGNYSSGDKSILMRLSDSKLEVYTIGNRIIISSYVLSRHRPGDPDPETYPGDHVFFESGEDFLESSPLGQYAINNLGAVKTTAHFHKWRLNPGLNTADGIWWYTGSFAIETTNGPIPPLSNTICLGYDAYANESIPSHYTTFHMNKYSVTSNDSQKSLPLFIKSPWNVYPPPGFEHLGSRTLFTRSYESMNENMPLFLKVREQHNDRSPLFIYGSLTALNYDAEVIPIYMPGPNLSANAWAPLYTSGDPSPHTGQTKSFVHDSTGLEDFTQFTVDDGAGQYTDNYSYSRIHATINDNSSSRLYQTNSVGHFNVSFEVRFELYIDKKPNVTDMVFHPIAFTNGLGASSTWASSVEALAVQCYDYTGELRLRLKEYLNEEVSLPVDINPQRRYYVKIVRLSNKVTLSVYSDSSYTILVGSPVNLYTTSNVKYQYCMVGDTLDNATGDSMTYILDNLKYDFIFMEGNTTLFTAGIGMHTDSATLYIKGFGTAANSYIPLQVYGTDDLVNPTYWTEGSIGLFLKDTQSSNKGRALFIKNTESSISFMPDYGLKLFVKGRGDILTGNLPLVVFNEQIAATLPLFMKGPQQVYAGSSGANETLPIYIYRPDESAVMPLMIYNNTPTSNSYIPMFIDGILGNLNAQMPLVIPSAVGELNSYADMFVKGVVPVTASLPLVMSSTTGPLTGEVPLFIQHGGGLVNSYANLYMFGAYITTASIPLAMPEIVEIPVDNIILYTQGY
jgi:hypothetical protein